jgi:hypothetical protein
MPRPKNEAQKEKITVWLEPDVHAGLRRAAAELDLSLSETTNTFLRKAVVTHELDTTSEAVTRRLETVVKRSVASMADSLSYLISVAAIEAGTTRRVLYQDLLKRHSPDEAKVWNSEARKDTVRRLRESPDELLKLILEEHNRSKLNEED